MNTSETTQEMFDRINTHANWQRFAIPAGQTPITDAEYSGVIELVTDNARFICALRCSDFEQAESLMIASPRLWDWVSVANPPAEVSEAIKDYLCSFSELD